MQIETSLHPLRQAEINRRFEAHWNIQLPYGVNVTVKLCRALAKDNKQFSRKEVFDMLFGVKPACKDKQMDMLCIAWNNSFTAYLLEHAEME